MPLLILPSGHAAPAAPAAFPQVIVEIQFTQAAWTDVSAYVDYLQASPITISRPCSRSESPWTRYDAGTAAVAFQNGDRRFDPANLAGPYVAGGATLVVPRVAVRFRAVYASVSYGLFSGNGEWDPLSYDPPSDARASLACTDAFGILGGMPRAPKPAFAGGGEDSGARVNRVLDDAGWPAGSRSVTKGDATLQPTLLGAPVVGVVPLAVTAAGGSAPASLQQVVSASTPLDELQLVAETELGELYAGAGGFIHFRHRSGTWLDARSATSQATFGDDPAVPTTELAYAGVQLDYTTATMWNGAAIANAGGNLQQAADAASQQQPPVGFGPRVYDQEALIADSDWQALAYAQWVVAAFKSPELRFTAISIDPVADPVNLFPQVLARQIGDRITVRKRPPGGGSMISRDCWIRGITHVITDSTWLTTWDLQDATSMPQPFVIGDATNGVIGVSKIGF